MEELQLWCSYEDSNARFLLGPLDVFPSERLSMLAEANPEVNYFVVKIVRTESTDVFKES